MKIKVKYYYKQKFLPTNRHTKERTRQLEDTVSVSIPELPESEFPVAFIVHNLQSVQPGMKSYEDYNGNKCDFTMFPEEIRTYKGKLYIPIRITHGAAISTEFECEEHIVYLLERIHREKLCFCDAEYSEKSIVVSEEKEDFKRDIRKEAKNYIYSCGHFWRVCNEPRYKVQTFGLGNNHGGTGFFIEFDGSGANRFNALERDDAIKYGRAVAKNRGDTESIDIIGRFENIEVLMPEMVKLKPNKMNM